MDFTKAGRPGTFRTVILTSKISLIFFFLNQKILIGVGKDGSESPFMSYPLDYDHFINYIAFASWAENTNHYIFDSGVIS